MEQRAGSKGQPTTTFFWGGVTATTLAVEVTTLVVEVTTLAVPVTGVAASEDVIPPLFRFLPPTYAGPAASTDKSTSVRSPFWRIATLPL